MQVCRPPFRRNVVSHPFTLGRKIFLAWTLLLVGCVSSPAQQTEAQQMSLYLGQTVSSVDVAGRPDVTFDKVSRLIPVKAGKPLTQSDVDASIAALKSSEGFQDIGISIEPDADGIRVLFVLKPAFYIGMYQFPGGLKEYPYSRLLQVSNYNAPAPYSSGDVSHAENALVQFFRQDGYFKAEVRPEIVTDDAHHLANVVFHIDLGRRAKIGAVNLTGANAQETALLHRKLRSPMARLKADSLKPGMRFSRYRLQSASRYLESVLAKQSYLTGEVKLVSAEYDPATNRADVTFNVTTGSLVKIKPVGAHVWARTLRSLVPIYDENAVNDELIKEGQRNIVSHFQAKGYFDTKVDVSTVSNDLGQSIVYDIHKDGRHKVDEVSFKGNRHFGNRELQSHVSVQKARFYSHGKYSQALVRSSATNLKNLYRSAGYSQAEVVPEVNRRNGNVEVTFQVTEGPLDVVDALHIEGNTTMPESEVAAHGLKLGAGKPYSQTLVTQDRNQILATYLTQGYLNASFRSTARPVPNKPNHLEVTYMISEGPQVKTATIITEGRDHTQQSLIDRAVRVKPGAPINENVLLSSESRLYNEGIFDWAEIDPRRAITDQQSEDVVVKVHEAKRNSIVYGFGFQVINRGGSVPSGTVAVPGIPPVGLPNGFITSQKTFWGPDGSFQYTRRNLLGRAESFTVSAFAGRLDQRAGFVFTDPSFRGSRWKGSALITVEHSSENPIFTARLGNAGYQFQRALNEKKTTNLFLRYNFQLTRISNLLIPDLVPPNQLNVRLSTLSASFIHDTRDNVLDAHRGIYESYEVSVNPAWLGSNFSFASFLGQVAAYKTVRAGIVWANSLRLGLEQAYAGSEVPLSQRFFSGGGSTLRGFPLNGAGPQRVITACGNPNDPATCSKITVPDGGNELLILNSELRFPLNAIKNGLGVVAFYDGGNVFPTIGFHNFTALYSNSVGIGLRYATPVGPLRIDIGHNLNPVPGIKPTQYFITLGQAF
jgi:outer membrane protein assembly factor BamA